MSESIFDISHCKKLKGFSDYYRKRIGDYRLGFQLIDENTITLILFCHRAEIYTKFP